MQLPRVASLDALPMAVSERAEWMRRTGIDVFELDLADDPLPARAWPSPTATPAFATWPQPAPAVGELLARPNTFVTSEVGEAGLGWPLQAHAAGQPGHRGQPGAVRPDYEPPAQFEEWFTWRASAPRRTRPKRELNLTQAAYARLTQGQLDQLRSSGLISDRGLVLDHGQVLLPPAKGDFSDKRLKTIFPTAKSDELLLMREALERALKIQLEVAGKLCSGAMVSAPRPWPGRPTW